MIESNPLGKLVRTILKIVLILAGLTLIIGPMIGTRGASAVELGSIVVGAVSTVFGLIFAALLSMLARVLVKIKAPSPVLMGIVIAAAIAGYVLGYFIGRMLLNISVIIGIILLIVGFLAAAYCTLQTSLLLSMAMISPALLDDEERETLRRNVKHHAIPKEFTTGKGAETLDRLLLEQGLVSRAYILMSDE